jgi:DNA-3-methyladenine glycosylase II
MSAPESPHEFLRRDEYLGPLVEEHGELTVEPANDFFERFVVSIIRQQVSMASATATRERLFEAVEVAPEGILAADDEVLQDAGLSRQKTTYVNNIAETFVEKGYSREYFVEMSDDAIRDALTEISGVGPWTADMQLIFSLGRPDVFPVGDLGIRKGMVQLFDDLDRRDRTAMVERSQRWAPYRSYASLYLWRATEA